MKNVIIALSEVGCSKLSNLIAYANLASLDKQFDKLRKTLDVLKKQGKDNTKEYLTTLKKLAEVSQKRLDASGIIISRLAEPSKVDLKHAAMRLRNIERKGGDASRAINLRTSRMKYDNKLTTWIWLLNNKGYAKESKIAKKRLNFLN